MISKQSSVVVVLLAVVFTVGLCKAQTGFRRLNRIREMRNQEQLNGRELDVEMYKGPIRILFDTSFMERDLKMMSGSRLEVDFAMNVLQDAKRYFEETLTVHRPKFYQNSKDEDDRYCEMMAVPEKSREADLTIFIRILAKDSPAFASAATCLYNSYNNSPRVGIIYIMPKHVLAIEENRHMYFPPFLHEMIHILAFSKSNLPKFRELPGFFDDDLLTTAMGQDKILGKQVMDGKEYQILKTEGILKYARSYFNCDKINGVPLENEGRPGAIGSHFDKRFLSDEAMNPNKEMPATISRFTLQVLHDSGWYEVDFNMATDYSTGKGAGCGFFFGNDLSHAKGYCKTKEKKACSIDFKGITGCRFDTHSGGRMYRSTYNHQFCPSNYLSPDTKRIRRISIETKGAYSRCWNTVNKVNHIPLCLKSECVGGKPVFYLGGKAHTCKQQGQTFKLKYRYQKAKEDFDYQSDLVCPNPAEFCGEFKKRCPGDCGGSKGICLVSGKCFMYSGLQASGRQVQMLDAEFF